MSENKKERLCIFCEHCNWDDSRGFGSSMTGPYGSAGFQCGAGHFSSWHEGDVDSLENTEGFRKLFLRANTCPDYFQPLDKEKS